MSTLRHGIWLFALLLIGALSTPISAQDDNSIRYDQVVTGEITKDIPEIHYTFTGSAGDTIIVSMSNIGTEEFYLDSHLELFGPDSQSLYTAGDYSWQWANPLKLQIGPVTLPKTGNYTIIVTRPMQQEGGFELVI